MSSVINFSALIDQVTKENRFFMKDMKLPVTCHQKKRYESFHIIEIKYPGIRRPNPCSVCLPCDTKSWKGVIPYMSYVGKYR